MDVHEQSGVFRRRPNGNVPAVSAILVVWCIGACAWPATVTLLFHDSALVNDTLFTVGDIARVTGSSGEVTGAVTACVAGTCAPPGYNRFISAADLVSFRLKTGFPEVAFTCTGSKRPLVRTDFRMIRLSDHEAELRSWIASTIGWKAGEWEVTVDNPADSCALLDKPVSLSFDGLENRFPKGSTNLSMIARQGSRSRRIPVRCRFSVNAPVVVTVKPIGRGDVLQADDCEIRRMDITRFAPAPYTSVTQIRNKRATRSIAAGAILHDRLLANIPAIEKNDAVSIVYEKGRISVTVSGIARERGAVGDRIWVENRQTHKLIRAVIRKKGTVSLLQGGVSI
ncbi:MAG: flagellar basal body P-ring formation protein FlgA [Chitinispirillaceae bacterium]|nr:flagellar basal body P-ring formation protein FlgA [Chitinispirillaceae bacterium]